ncbi:MAG: sigma-54-dependent Fis family transcriptional regulator [Deltaproteobacteria bacterium]|nr:sigma-54-dependent Fis family transcriptional regulator [Deltaproteobacteria bacterium]
MGRRAGGITTAGVPSTTLRRATGTVQHGSRDQPGPAGQASTDRFLLGTVPPTAGNPRISGLRRQLGQSADETRLAAIQAIDRWRAETDGRAPNPVMATACEQLLRTAFADTAQVVAEKAMQTYGQCAAFFRDGEWRLGYRELQYASHHYGPTDSRTLAALQALVAIVESLQMHRDGEPPTETAATTVSATSIDETLAGPSAQFFGGMLSVDPVMHRIFDGLNRAANTPLRVLLQGETGTGKDLAARELHARSPRARKAFVPVNCGAIPAELFESELFGHEKGAFTGAVQRRIGLFEEAHRGTLFLDEIGELSYALQAKLLRVLESGTFYRVGGGTSVQVDVRVISATNRPLQQACTAGRFREDLFHRINPLLFTLPPLREHPGDIVAIAEWKLAQTASDLLPLSDAVREHLLSHPWHGNVRELLNALERGVILANGQPGGLTPADLSLQNQIGHQWNEHGTETTSAHGTSPGLTHR